MLAQTVAGYCFILREFRLNVNSVLHFLVRVDAFGEFGKLLLVFQVLRRACLLKCHRRATNLSDFSTKPLFSALLTPWFNFLLLRMLLVNLFRTSLACLRLHLHRVDLSTDDEHHWSSAL